MTRHLITACFVLCAALAGCSEKRELFSPENVGTLVVDAVFIVDEPLPKIRLTRTQAPDKPFDFEAAAEGDATVTVRGEGLTFNYRWVYDSYVYGAARNVLPNTTYHLRIVTSRGEVVTASTTTPSRMEATEWVLLDDDGTSVRRRLQTFETMGDSVFNAPENQLLYADGLLEVRIEPGAATGYQVGLYSLDLDSDFVIDPEFLDEEDFEEFERNICSPPVLPDETAIRLPWFAIYFEGRYEVDLFAVDRNWYDLARSAPGFGGDGGLGGNIGDNFEKPIFHIDGGIGLFGSASVVRTGFYVHPRP